MDGQRPDIDFNVIVEIPMNGDPIKYELDKESGAMFVDRFMSTAMHYPCPAHQACWGGNPGNVCINTTISTANLKAYR